ncbi:carboxy terminal-processing peptidase [Chitinophaga nivalis]|uniref:Carboxy terminal-processing peptidase n=1 Tax=Chitinophaga nivalis TaxID=2991709 RepID=A0ABT3IHN9_9BACT|nr:carboxy terminal-processing peptidase [Chitinophaga nivalis]MCW3467030.1 carboxy terminal-processing peptidase [Chitinophaga nivalis]MCW3483279.1 carboxy terminal-processing peptidase [Chitinophaga nivalis]
MKAFIPGSRLLLTCCAVATGMAAMAQAPADPNKIPAYHSAVITHTIDKIKKKHFNPKPIDDTYSAAVWNRFIYTLDPNSYFFLQGDIAQLAGYKHQIDDELNTGSTAFFDATYKLYSERVKEASQLCTEILATPFDFSKKESVMGWRKELPFPANKTERAELWRKLLKYYTLRHYMEMKVAAGDSAVTLAGVDTAIEAKAREKVRKFYESFFRQAMGNKSAEEKFTQYVTVVTMEIDPHTVYAGPKDQSFNEALNKRYFGLGMELGTKEADYYVKRLLPGGTAYRSGEVKENDNIIAVADSKGDMLPVTGLAANEVTGMIRGEKGTAVKMTLQQPGEKARVVTVRRDEVIDMENRAKSAVVEKDGKRFGYIYLPMFYTDVTGNKTNGAFNDVAREVEKLKEEEVAGIIMDLRGNGGGALDEVVRMGACFVPGGPMSWLRAKTVINRYNSPEMPPLYDGPLTVLVDENSASASEIFAAAMQDLGRGLIIGTSSTFGKGTAQMNVNIGKLGDPQQGTTDVSYGSMRLTVEKFYRINGTSTQLKGVIPDIILQDKMNLLSFVEKDFTSALAFDTVGVMPFKRVPLTFDYNTVVEKARTRIARNTAYMAVAANTQRLKALTAQPAALDLATFRAQYLQSAGYEKAIRDAKVLQDSQRLIVSLSANRSINPLLRKDEAEKTTNKDWLQRISTDVYIAETIQVMEDMLTHPMAATNTH